MCCVAFAFFTVAKNYRQRKRRKQIESKEGKREKILSKLIYVLLVALSAFSLRVKNVAVERMDDGEK